MPKGYEAKEGQTAQPALIVPTSPFTLVVLGDEDIAKVSLGEVNQQTYDHLPYCRTTMTVDGGLPRHGVMLSYTGAFLFPQLSGVDKDFVVRSTNLILMNLVFGGILFDAVAPDDVAGALVYNTGYFMVTTGAAGPNLQRLSAFQHRDASTFDSMLLMHPRIFKKKDIEEALEKGRTIAKSLPELNPSILLDGLTAYKQRRYAASLIFLWSSIEAMIGRIWDDKVVSAGAGIGGRAAFVRSRSWQAAHKIEVVFQIGIVPPTLYSKLNAARTARNQLAHRGETPSKSSCDAAMESVFSLMSLVVSEYLSPERFAHVLSTFLQTHAPPAKVAPRYWREIPPIPGNHRWGDAPFKRYPELELVPMDPVGASEGPTH